MSASRTKWSDVEEALLMEVYPQSRVAGGNLGWGEIAALMNANAASRGIEVLRTFRENTVRSHWNDRVDLVSISAISTPRIGHLTSQQLLARYGNGGRVAGFAAGAPSSSSGSSSAFNSRESTMEPPSRSAFRVAVAASNAPAINHHPDGPPGWVEGPVLLRAPFSGWTPINQGARPSAASPYPAIYHRSQSVDAENPSMPTSKSSRESENVSSGGGMTEQEESIGAEGGGSQKSERIESSADEGVSDLEAEEPKRNRRSKKQKTAGLLEMFDI
ncbi:hypothetical protein HYALB_00002922 [Hymenoscyphus albidus]|uniref:Myb-like domain-containing protein n=1 Tax=Hymenoscyphus albidus TaxID=595503 RepID=A0A9N9Q7L4_9HELO|nr:hypothetical protein HYALB_00002922 [Hymenoscyphus albidus]